MSAHLALYHARGAGRLCKTITTNSCYRFLCAIYVSKVAGVALHQHAWRLQHRAAALCRRRRRQVARSPPTAISSQIRLLRLPRFSVAPIDLHLRCSRWPVCAATQPQPNMSAAPCCCACDFSRAFCCQVSFNGIRNGSQPCARSIPSTAANNSRNSLLKTATACRRKRKQRVCSERDATRGMVAAWVLWRRVDAACARRLTPPPAAAHPQQQQ